MRRRHTWAMLAAGGVVLVAAGALLLLFWRPADRSEPAGATGAAALYEQHCAVCHGASGKGDGPAARVVGGRIRDFTDPEAMRQVDDRFLFEIIKKGGSQFGRSNAMPAWGMKLRDTEIRGLVELIRSFSRSREKEAS